MVIPRQQASADDRIYSWARRRPGYVLVLPCQQWSECLFISGYRTSWGSENRELDVISWHHRSWEKHEYTLWVLLKTKQPVCAWLEAWVCLIYGQCVLSSVGKPKGIYKNAVDLRYIGTKEFTRYLKWLTIHKFSCSGLYVFLKWISNPYRAMGRDFTQ